MVIEAGWVWATLTVIFLLIEVLTVSFFFLLWAFSAAAVSVLTFFCHISWQWQVFAFILFSIPLWGLWVVLAKRWRSQPNDPAAHLNHRSSQYVGREFELQSPVVHGIGKLQIGDTFWKIAGENLPAGATIMITSAEDNVLHFCHVKK